MQEEGETSATGIMAGRRLNCALVRFAAPPQRIGPLVPIMNARFRARALSLCAPARSLLYFSRAPELCIGPCRGFSAFAVRSVVCSGGCLYWSRLDILLGGVDTEMLG